MPGNQLHNLNINIYSIAMNWTPLLRAHGAMQHLIQLQTSFCHSFCMHYRRELALLSVPEVGNCNKAFCGSEVQSFLEVQSFMEGMDSRFGSRPWALPECGKINNKIVSSCAPCILFSINSGLQVNTCKFQIFFYFSQGDVFKPCIHCPAIMDIHSTLMS